MSGHDKLSDAIYRLTMAGTFFDHELLADGLIADGYQKQRTVDTIEELDALPGGSVIRGMNEIHAWGRQLYEARIEDPQDPPKWVLASMPLDGGLRASKLIHLARQWRVLYEPDNEAVLAAAVEAGQ